ncbi:ankyrin repeat domain-containing protein [Brevibacillus aydinogluensis]|jgi:ankyrin repeat protein|uniref:Ankyrin repeat domain-containing protein n=1 Tax=Brevibacillus aydinogluensis TaxID=927786 RepID=A0AA48M7E9_9BACL|nr:ankyrin repeat domain-containing protein [Brevibacillus aydinogluensis]CAJ1002035.1 ankyrin repeat domain-containing protein [Brevibacillus aydinogluensis]
MKKYRGLILWGIFILLLGISIVAAISVQSDRGPVYNYTYNEEFNPNNFFDAVLKGDIEKVKSFINKSMDPNITDEEGRTALFIAVREKNVELAKYLLSVNADPNIKDFYDDSPLELAKGYNNKDLVDLLIQHGARE